MPTHSWPRSAAARDRFGDAWRSSSGATRTSAVPNGPSPNAVANRRAGSTVSTSTRAPSCVAAMAPSEAEMVVLPVPPLPHTTIISFDANSASRPGRELRPFVERFAAAIRRSRRGSLGPSA
jgi:hypothetical protein